MLLTFMVLSPPTNIAIDIPATVIQESVMLLCLARAGLLALAVVSSHCRFSTYAPIAPDLTRWYSSRGVSVMLLMMVARVYTFRVSLKHRHVLLDLGMEN